MLMPRNLRRLILAGGCAVALSAAPIVAVVTDGFTGSVPSVVADCPNGQTLSPGTGQCMASAPDGSTAGDDNSTPEANGIPCQKGVATPCLGLQQLQDPPTVQPSSTLEGAE